MAAIDLARRDAAVDSDLRLKVDEVVDVARGVRSFVLSALDEAPLPTAEPGAHLNIYLPDGDHRSYSLISLAGEALPHTYRIAVLLEEGGRGGSRYMHALEVGAELRAAAPANHFPLHSTDRRPVFLAGGIGITPILSMVDAMRHSGLPFDLHYSARSRDRLAFLPELSRLAGEFLTIHCDDGESRLDLPRFLDGLSPQQPIYVCGPTGLIDATIAGAAARGWRGEDIRFEHFSAPAIASGDDSFEVELRSSGDVFVVPPDQTILDVLIAAGVDALYDCRRGDCGICQVGVIAGEPDHRDYILSDTERAAGNTMQICVSRSKSKRLVLDL